MKHKFQIHDETGIVLITGLMLIALLSVLSAAAYLISSTELMISRNWLVEKKAFYMAEAGMEEARARLPDFLEDGSHSGKWRAFLYGGAIGSEDFSEYDSGNQDHHLYASLQSDMTCLVEIRHMSEQDLGVDLNNDSDVEDTILWGDGNGDFVYDENTVSGLAIEIISSVGISGKAKKKAVSKIRPLPVFLEPPAALYANGNINKTGGAGSAIGRRDGCEAIPDVMTTAGATSDGQKAGDWPAGSSDPSWFVETGNAKYPIEEAMERAKSRASETIVPGDYSFVSYGDPGDRFKIFFSPGDLNLNSLSGYGLLAVEGSLALSGNILWEGVIIAKGGVTINGLNSQKISGAVISGENVKIAGGPDILYDCDIVRNLRRYQSDYRVLWWKHFE